MQALLTCVSDIGAVRRTVDWARYMRTHGPCSRRTVTISSTSCHTHTHTRAVALLLASTTQLLASAAAIRRADGRRRCESGRASERAGPPVTRRELVTKIDARPLTIPRATAGRLAEWTTRVGPALPPAMFHILRTAFVAEKTAHLLRRPSVIRRAGAP